MVVNPDPTKIITKENHLFYDVIAEQLKAGSSVFVSDVGKRQASYARKRLSLLVGKTVVAKPIIYQNLDGYHFEIGTNDK